MAGVVEYFSGSITEAIELYDSIISWFGIIGPALFSKSLDFIWFGFPKNQVTPVRNSKIGLNFLLRRNYFSNLGFQVALRNLLLG